MRVPDETTAGGMVRELLDVLDDEIELLNLRRSQLEVLSGAMLDRDEQAVGELLGEIEDSAQRQAATDLKLQAVRIALASAMGISAEGLKLSDIIEALRADVRPQVNYRRQQVILLIEALRAQHMETAFLVHECARINRVLLEGLFQIDPRPVTYAAGGKAGWAPHVGLIDMER